MSKQTLILDSTQLSHYFDCPRLWYFEDVRNLTPKVYPPKDLMIMGSLGHKYLEIYYKRKAKGETSQQALECAFSIDLDKEVCKCGHEIEKHGQESTGHPTEITPCLEKDCTCKQFTPVPFPLSKENIYKVKKQLSLYQMKWDFMGDYIIESDSQVELGFSYPLHEDDQYLFVLEGKIDLHNILTKQGTRIGFVDHKFQGRKKDLYHYRVQFKNYALATNASTAAVNYIRFTQKVDEETFNRQSFTFTPMNHQAWKARLIDVYKRIAKSVELGTIDPNFWITKECEPNWGSCEGKYGYPCAFTKVCEEYVPELINIKLDTQFEQKQLWKPWE